MTAPPQRFLIGKEGRDAVVSALSAEDPRRVLQRFQSQYSLDSLLNTQCQPALKLLELLGTSRAEMNSGLLSALSESLADRTANMAPDPLTHLIQMSYPYVAFDELRPTVFEAMRRHGTIPGRVLDLLLADPYLKTHRPDILSSLAPIQVRQQLWARDPKGAFAFMLESISCRYRIGLSALTADFVLEIASGFRQAYLRLHQPSDAVAESRAPDLLSSSDAVHGTQLKLGATMDAETERAHATRLLASIPGVLARRVLRRRKSGACGQAVDELLANIGSSVSLYSAALEWLRTEQGLSDLRHDLVMAAHDADQRALCDADPIYRVAWVIDACLKDNDFDERRLKEIEALLLSAHPVEVSRGKPARLDGGVTQSADGMRLRSRKLAAAAGSGSDSGDESFDLGAEWLDVSSDDADEADYHVSRSAKRRKRSTREVANYPTGTDATRAVHDCFLDQVLALQLARRARLLSQAGGGSMKDSSVLRLLRVQLFPTAPSAVTMAALSVVTNPKPARGSLPPNFGDPIVAKVFLWQVFLCVVDRDADMLAHLAGLAKGASAQLRRFDFFEDWRLFFVGLCASLPDDSDIYAACSSLCASLLFADALVGDAALICALASLCQPLSSSLFRDFYAQHAETDSFSALFEEHVSALRRKE